MDWVVTTGRTVEAAKERALDALGIDVSELDFEILAEPSSSLFGLRRTEASIRARVRPTRPRPKVDRRNRSKRRDGGRRRKGRDRGQDRKATGDRSDQGPPADPARQDDGPEPAPTAPPPSPPAATSQPAPPAPTRAARSESRKPARSSGPRGATAMSDITLDEQEPTAVDFVTGLVEAFGFDADVSADREDDETVEIHVEGDDLGLLVGPRGTTLSSITELTRTAVAQQHSGRLEGRLRVDVAGYRARRKEALIRFAGQIADKVLDTGDSVALEPMSPPDRKIVHDAVNDIDGVHTESRGEDRQRHVVVHAES